MASGYRRKTDALPTCMNCGSVLYGEFCSSCGQQGTARITLGMAAQRARSLFFFDFAWSRTAAALTLDPGRWIRRYLRGARLPYVAPVPYALFGVGLLIMVAWLAKVDLSGPYTPWSPKPGQESTFGFFVVSILAVFPVLFPVAALQCSLYRDAKYNLAETYVFGLYVYGHLALYQMVFALAGGFSSLIGLISLALSVVLVLAYALSGFYKRKIWAVLPAALILGTSIVAGIIVVGSLARLFAE